MTIRITKKNIEIIILIALVFMLMAFNTDNPDFNNYVYRYNMQNFGGLENGFGIINQFFFKMGLTFIQFRIVVYFLGTWIIFKSISKITDNLPFIIFSYMILIMCFDTIQLRNYIASVLIIAGIPCLMKKNIKGDIVFGVLCVLAGSIHVVMLYYLLLLICRHINNSRKYFKIMCATCVLLIAASFSGLSGNVINTILNSNRAFAYTQTRVGNGIIIYILFFVLTAYLIRVIFREKARLEKEDSLFETLQESDKFIINIFITLIPVLGLMCMNAIFLRIIRTMLVYLFVFVGNSSKNHGLLTIKKNRLVFAVWFVFIAVWFYGEAFDETFLFIFKNNLLLGG